MVKVFEKYYNVLVFLGVLMLDGLVNYLMFFCFVVVKGGFEKIVVYWGLLEMVQKGLGMKVVLWVLFVGGNIWDEMQEMWVCLKVVVVDVKMGQWVMFLLELFQDIVMSVCYSWEFFDQV